MTSALYRGLNDEPCEENCAGESFSDGQEERPVRFELCGPPPAEVSPTWTTVTAAASVPRSSTFRNVFCFTIST